MQSQKKQKKTRKTASDIYFMVCLMSAIFYGYFITNVIDSIWYPLYQGQTVYDVFYLSFDQSPSSDIYVTNMWLYSASYMTYMQALFHFFSLPSYPRTRLCRNLPWLCSMTWVPLSFSVHNWEPAHKTVLQIQLNQHHDDRNNPRQFVIVLSREPGCFVGFGCRVETMAPCFMHFFARNMGNVFLIGGNLSKPDIKTPRYVTPVRRGRCFRHRARGWCHCIRFHSRRDRRKTARRLLKVAVFIPKIDFLCEVFFFFFFC